MSTDGGGVVAIPLQGCQALAYTAPVTIGSQRFQLVVDTGSTTTIVASASCSDCTTVSPLYMPSPQATDVGTMDTSQYGTGSVTGTVYRDSVQLPGVPESVSLDFLAVDSESMFPLFDAVDCSGAASSTAWADGIVGFGPSDIALHATQSYLPELSAAGIEPDIFALQLCSSGGNLWIGGFDPSHTSAAPEYTPLASSPYYAVTVSDMGLNGTSLGVSDYGASVVDSGTNVFILPADAYEGLTTQVVASSAFQAAFAGQTSAFFADLLTSNDPCVQSTGGLTAAQVDAMLPPLTVTLPGQTTGTITLTLAATKSYLRVLTEQGLTLFCPNVASAASVGPAGEVPTILANALMGSYVTIFDIQNSRVGFAPQTGCP